MSQNPEPSGQEEKSVHTVIQQIKDGSLNPRALDKETRQQCVEVLTAEGTSTASMAQILGKSEKTIQRDLAEIRAKNAVTPSIDMAKEIVGELLTYARTHRAYLMRLARAKDASVAEKAQAEYLAARVGMELIQKLQTLGYLPLKPQEIIADLKHHMSVDDEKSFLELRDQINEIERIAKESGELTPAMEKELAILRLRIEKVEIQNKVIEVSIVKPEARHE